MKRKLAAILAADVVSYSKLKGVDEIDAAQCMDFLVSDIGVYKRPECIDYLLGGFRKAGLLA